APLAEGGRQVAEVGPMTVFKAATRPRASASWATEGRSVCSRSRFQARAILPRGCRDAAGCYISTPHEHQARREPRPERRSVHRLRCLWWQRRRWWRRLSREQRKRQRRGRRRGRRERGGRGGGGGGLSGGAR